jgi:hypothetical protein
MILLIVCKGEPAIFPAEWANAPAYDRWRLCQDWAGPFLQGSASEGTRRRVAYPVDPPKPSGDCGRRREVMAGSTVPGLWGFIVPCSVLGSPCCKRFMCGPHFPGSGITSILVLVIWQANSILQYPSMLILNPEIPRLSVSKALST